MHPILLPTPEIADALATRRPVVALESTVISHGMPYPQNLETARALEAEVRAAGALPATIAVMDGRIRIGLDDEALERLATAGASARKLSRRDLPVAIATGALGATTVAATMIGARLAGISVFATGGIGGVHRGAEISFDISADLDELARTSVCVVCAGAKSILDLPKTLEVLETRGVPVLGFGTDEFPAFYSRRSGLPVDHRCDNVTEVADILRAKWQLGLEGGVLLANPIPAADELDADAMEAAVNQALADAEANNIKGKDITPHLLAALERITGGRSLTANIALIRNNARVAAGVAAALATP
ncbi:pseudouridine-5'-phosphate glycosidase [Azospirillum lipoferum]|uniref:Pseudouridine-5'-phosphate glycosidase n=1 Tax=Azospirillum lipoferum TaxID=193 RepID=A0A5A9GVQ3_AZOLI|nr:MULTISPECIES: pseudouridine-5'-phosphate glycosidase [Azospirillum]KAA0597852.1 pseudouridine-5'-phosphate glycosidase [Azospirillum lipoferum]MCP1610007.1 pseudouridine-5'-phosphate glycosidase [Azospirillum lipoferum]MDW5534500.1 pseudouridine-5'-phosphate glycosidase [Azospirillum sp. NL1]